MQTDHEVKIDVVSIEILERRGEAFLDTFVPRVVELCGQEDLPTRHTTVFDALAHFLFVAVGQSGVDVAIAGFERHGDGVADLIGLRLPCPETDCGDLCTCVQGEELAVAGR